MRSSSLASFVLVVAAAAIAWALGLRGGDPRAVGLLGGALLGAAVALLTTGWLRGLVLRRPRLVVHAFGGTMLVKLVVLAAAAAVLAWVPAVAERAHTPTSMLSLVGSLVLLGGFGVKDILAAAVPANTPGGAAPAARTQELPSAR